MDPLWVDNITVPLLLAPRYHGANDPACPSVDRQRHGCEGASEWIRVGAWVRRPICKP
jgi:hypothetical protein